MKAHYAVLLALGLGVSALAQDKRKPLPRDFKTLKTLAALSLKALAEKGDAEAQYMLGAAYGAGLWVNHDYKEAVKWFRKAAEQNYPQAQYKLGVMCRRGLGVEKNDKEAVSWYRKAAEQNYPQAQSILGDMFLLGRGVEKNDKEAVKWYRKAAEQNHPDAQYALGLKYRLGQGVEKDYVTAYAWYNIAAVNGHPVNHNVLATQSEVAKVRKSVLIEKMTPAQIVKAEALTKELQNKIEANLKVKKK